MTNWTTPRTWVADEIVTSSQLNEQLRDNEEYLKDRTDDYDRGQLFLTAAGGWPSSSSGAEGPTKREITANLDVYTLDFGNSWDEYAQWSLIMPQDWDGGVLTAEFYWVYIGAASAGQTVEWNLQGRATASGSALDQFWTSAQSVSQAASAAYTLHITGATAAITLGGSPAPGQFVQLRGFRDVSDDNLGGDALLLGVLVEFGRS